jgi:hypothetical protein
MVGLFEFQSTDIRSSKFENLQACRTAGISSLTPNIPAPQDTSKTLGPSRWVLEQRLVAVHDAGCPSRLQVYMLVAHGMIASLLHRRSEPGISDPLAPFILPGLSESHILPRLCSLFAAQSDGCAGLFFRERGESQVWLDHCHLREQLFSLGALDGWVHDHIIAFAPCVSEQARFRS